MAIVEKMEFLAKRLAHPGEKLGNVAQIRLRSPLVLVGQSSLRWFVPTWGFGDSVGAGKARDPALHTNRLVAHLPVFSHVLQGMIDILPIRVCVDHEPLSALAAQQI